MPDELKIDDAVGMPRPCLHVARGASYDPRRLTATLAFDYDGYAMEADSEARGVFLRPTDGSYGAIQMLTEDGRPRRLDHDLRHASTRHRNVERCPVRLRDSRRSPGREKRGIGGSQGRTALASQASTRIERHTGRESSRRTVEPVRVSQSRPAGRQRIVPTREPRIGHREEWRTGDARARPAAVHPSQDEGSGSAGATAEDRADAALRVRPRRTQAVQRTAGPLPRVAAREGEQERPSRHVLEALLRLRQAACHPGLIDKTRAEQSSAKLDVLYE